MRVPSGFSLVTNASSRERGFCGGLECVAMGKWIDPVRPTTYAFPALVDGDRDPLVALAEEEGRVHEAGAGGVDLRERRHPSRTAQIHMSLSRVGLNHAGRRRKVLGLRRRRSRTRSLPRRARCRWTTSLPQPPRYVE